MCTVTYVPISDGFCLTSSRDERTNRATLIPQFYSYNKYELVYPRDEQSGGTWIAANNLGRVACLLNGAFIQHTKQNCYTTSRGTILLNSFNYSTIYEFIQNSNVKDVEPFTLLLLDYKSQFNCVFYEYRWDGNNKHIKKLCSNTTQIWSSSTLYPAITQHKRQNLFEDWLLKYKDFEDKMIYHFHAKKHGLAAAEDILMKAENGIETLSITQLKVNRNEELFNYTDIIKNKFYSLNLKNSLQLSA